MIELSEQERRNRMVGSNHYHSVLTHWPSCDRHSRRTQGAYHRRRSRSFGSRQCQERAQDGRNSREFAKGAEGDLRGDLGLQLV